MKLLFSVGLLVCIALAVEGRSGGAPAAPYSIDSDDGDGGFEYTSGETYTYTCKLLCIKFCPS